MKKLILFFIAFVCKAAFSAFPASSVSGYSITITTQYGQTATGFGSTRTAARLQVATSLCPAFIAQKYPYANYKQPWSTETDEGCIFRNCYAGGSCDGWDSQNYFGGSTTQSTQYQCPSNSTLSGSSCSCNSGYVQEGSQCVAFVDPCDSTQGLTTGYTRLEVQFSNVNPSPSALGSFVGQTVKTAVPINGNSCAATGKVESCALAGTTLYCILTGSTYTGATYNGEQSLFGLPQIDPNATPENQLPKVCPEGQYAGEVNGTQVCVKANGSANTTQSTTTNPDGTSTTTTTTTACVGDKCTSTTTTETKDAQGNTTGTGTSKVEGDKDAFCMANPQAPECKNTKSNFGGTCDAAFTCESEDAVMCAIALDQYKTNCELLKRDDNLGQNLADLIDMPLTDLDLDTTSIQAPQASGSSCSITPFSIPVGIGAFTVDLTHMCAYLSIIKAIVTAFGFVMWTLIVFVRQ